jgi:hypothetical protein
MLDSMFDTGIIPNQRVESTTDRNAIQRKWLAEHCLPRFFD